MGLFSNEPDKYLRWLDDKAWEACGYEIKNIEILLIDRRQYITQILNIIDDLRRNNPTLQPDDIGIMFLENINENIVKEIMDKICIEKMYRSKLNSIIKSGYKDELDCDRLYKIIRM